MKTHSEENQLTLLVPAEIISCDMPNCAYYEKESKDVRKHWFQGGKADGLKSLANHKYLHCTLQGKMHTR